MTSVSEVSDETFGSVVLASERPVLVDFWAPWCGPCLLVSPVVEELAAELDGRITMVKLNIDDNLATSTRYSVFSIPTLVIFKSGVEVERIVGFRRKAELAERLAAHL